MKLYKHSQAALKTNEEKEKEKEKEKEEGGPSAMSATEKREYLR